MYIVFPSKGKDDTIEMLACLQQTGHLLNIGPDDPLNGANLFDNLTASDILFVE